MAQLIKLQDYISRYQNDIFRYPSQFIRLKKENYKGVLNQWEQDKDQLTLEAERDDWFEEDKESKLKRFFQRKKPPEEEEVVTEPIPNSELELKQAFLNQIFDFQLKWASSTLQEVSFLDQYYSTNATLKYFLTRFPDTFLVMYEPLFKIQKALIEVEVVIVTPTSVLCISILPEEEVTYDSLDQRKWVKNKNQQKTNIVNPNISLNRMANTVESILNQQEVDFPVHRILLARDAFIKAQTSSKHTTYVDRSNYEYWFEKQRKEQTPLKHQQLKAAGALLEYTQVTSIKRPEWESVSDDF
ncbi:hypothetical protein [Halalkalibacillus halophilus]|uniref:hypothetical protein n=1 Tax=Halalkalibacillus halophilus TaxID=392827 RepID=UPI000429474C|nr:hypothetical protein [Halalkalibacillus halophilus]